ncbi:MAG: ABC transporter permease [Gemmatimonadetes bacterium]|nr:ABC transporter permease [Gemmatimonadota bacterium]
MRVRSLWHGVFRTRQVDADLDDEFRLHIELRTADLVCGGMTPAEATRMARAEFGSTAHYMEQARTARGLRWFDEARFSWLDLKLGCRMLAKYPVLTLVGGFSMAFAIGMGAGTFEVIRQLVFPAIPLPDADRIVMLQNWDASANSPELRSTHDFLTWRGSLQSVQDLGAYRTATRNLTIVEGLAEPVSAAEASAAAFRVLRVPPVLGRTLVEADEQPDAPRVVVIGHGLWQDRFNGDSGVIGRTVRVTGAPSVIVGVMPAGFAFPRSQELWVPLRIDIANTERRQGMAIQVVGRLAPGASLEQARAELTNLGRVASVDFPRTHQHLRPHLFTFAESVRALKGPGESMMLLAGNTYVILLLVLVCANVGLLIFARAATRETEILVRSALGASRRRIVMQMFAEALVLGGVAALVGLAAAGAGMRWGMDLMRAELTDGSGNFAFWVDGKLSPLTVVYTVLLTLLAAAIAGILPGLKITRNLAGRLRRTTAGAGGTTFGGVWTVLIVLQLAATMGFPVVTFFVRKDAVRLEMQPLPFPVDQYLSVRLDMERLPSEPVADTSTAAFHARYLAAAQRLETRLESEPDVMGVVFGQHLPRQYHPNHQVEVDEGAVAPHDERGHLVGSSNVDPKYLDVLGVPMLSGRWFHTREATPDARVAVVNKSFVDRVMGGRNPIGRRVRYVRKADPEAQPWFEIIGVAPDVGIRSGWGPAGIYRPLDRASMYPLNVAIHVRGDPRAFTPRLRAIATDVDVSLRLTDVMPLRDVVNGEVDVHAFWVRLTTIVSAMILVFSLVSIYAVMSFAVSRRTREIGVRVALGGRPWRIVTAVFAHPLRQLGMGLLAGTLLVWALQGGVDNGWPTATQLLTLGAYTTLMIVVCLVACVVPTWRALAVQPTEALRDH